MDINNFNKVWEIEYIIRRIKGIEQAIKEGNYEVAIDYLSMIRDKAESAIDYLKVSYGTQTIEEYSNKGSSLTDDVFIDLFKENGCVVTFEGKGRHVFNPFLEATKDKETIEEKEIKVRELLDMFKESDYASTYANQRLSDMSFLDDDPEWKERATKILREYTDKLTDGDKKNIDLLLISPRKELWNKIRKNPLINDEELLFIEDLSNERLINLLPKIDLYVEERYQQMVELGYYDEVWKLEYWSLKDKIKSRLGING